MQGARQLQVQSSRSAVDQFLEPPAFYEGSMRMGRTKRRLSQPAPGTAPPISNDLDELDQTTPQTLQYAYFCQPFVYCVVSHLRKPNTTLNNKLLA